jgi:hypothetical protein
MTAKTKPERVYLGVPGERYNRYGNYYCKLQSGAEVVVLLDGANQPFISGVIYNHCIVDQVRTRDWLTAASMVYHWVEKYQEVTTEVTEHETA